MKPGESRRPSVHAEDYSSKLMAFVGTHHPSLKAAERKPFKMRRTRVVGKKEPANSIKLKPQKSLKMKRRQSVMQYQSDLQRYHDEMEEWTIRRQESMKAQRVEHEQIESTMIDLIRVFVSEHRRVPTEDQIKEILESTSHHILKSEHLIDSDEDGSSSSSSDDDLESPPPPSLPERPDDVDVSDLTALEDIYLGHQPEPELVLDGDMKGYDIPRSLATKVNRSVVGNWKKLQYIHKWVRSGANLARVEKIEEQHRAEPISEDRDTYGKEEEEEEEEEYLESTNTVEQSERASAMWKRARQYVAAFHAANQLNRTYRKKKNEQLKLEQDLSRPPHP